ncbi:hypothetical protein NI447_07605 [Enterococcus lactis]|nr:hypothetical protein [Enterococcus lactis]
MNYLYWLQEGKRVEIKKNKKYVLDKNKCNPKLEHVMRLWRNWQTR